MCEEESIINSDFKLKKEKTYFIFDKGRILCRLNEVGCKEFWVVVKICSPTYPLI